MTKPPRQSELQPRWEANGPHISEKGLIRIFDKFYQEDPSRASAGNGLGLAIVKKIVVLHGGTISARNLPETGVEFTVCLPCGKPHYFPICLSAFLLVCLPASLLIYLSAYLLNSTL